MRLLRETLALAGIAAQLWVIVASWQELPAQVPTHYGFSGKADSYGDRKSVLVLPAVTLGLYALLTVVGRFPQRLNYPVEVTEQNRGRLEALAAGMLGWMKVELTWGFAYIEWTVVRQAQGLSNGLGWAFLPVDVGLIVGTLVIGVALMRRAE